MKIKANEIEKIEGQIRIKRRSTDGQKVDDKIAALNLEIDHGLLLNTDEIFNLIGIMQKSMYSSLFKEIVD